MHGERVQERAAECAEELSGAELTHPFGDDWDVHKVSGKVFMLFSQVEGQPVVILKSAPGAAKALVEGMDDITPGYHMNKEHWITLHGGGRLDGQLVDDLVTESYPWCWRSCRDGYATTVDLVPNAESEMNLTPQLIGGRSLSAPLSPAGPAAARARGVRPGRSPSRRAPLHQRRTLTLRCRAPAEGAGWDLPIGLEDGLVELSQGAAEGGDRAQWWNPHTVAEMRSPLWRLKDADHDYFRATLIPNLGRLRLEVSDAGIESRPLMTIDELIAT